MFVQGWGIVRDRVSKGIKVYKRKKFRGSIGKQNSEVGLNFVGPTT